MSPGIAGSVSAELNPGNGNVFKEEGACVENFCIQQNHGVSLMCPDPENVQI